MTDGISKIGGAHRVHRAPRRLHSAGLLAPREARRGSILAIMTVMLVTLCIVGAVAVNLGQIQLARVETQIVSDCASISAATMLGVPNDRYTPGPRELAQRVVQRNTILGAPAQIHSHDIELGRAEVTALGFGAFRPDERSPNAVRVTMRAGNGGAMQEFPVLFPILGRSTTFGFLRESISGNLAHDVVLVLDRSDTMNFYVDALNRPNHPDGTPGHFPPYQEKWENHPFKYLFPHPVDSRWAVMRDSLKSLVKGFKESHVEERLAVVTFGDDYQVPINGKPEVYHAADVDVPFTQNWGQINKVLQGKWNRRPMLSNGHNRIDAGIDQAVALFDARTDGQHAYKSIVLLSNNVQSSGDATLVNAHIAAARRAVAAGIQLHAIAFANENPKLEAGMRELATIGNGLYYEVQSGLALEQALEEIASNLPVSIIQ